MKTLTADQMEQVNSTMGNSLEFYDNEELLELFTKEYKIDKETAEKIISQRHEFETNVFYDINEK